MQRFHGLAAQWLTDKRVPACLRPARRGFAQAGLKLRHLTTCSDLQPKRSLVNCDTAPRGKGRVRDSLTIGNFLEVGIW